MSETAKQNIWRTVSVPDHNGVFVWDVIEFQGDEKHPYPTPSHGFVECRDGTYILPWCMHYFIIESAENHLNSQDLLEFGTVYHTI